MEMAGDIGMAVFLFGTMGLITYAVFAPRNWFGVERLRKIFFRDDD